MPSRSRRGSAYKGSAFWGAAAGGGDRGLTLQRGRTALRGSTAGPGDRICIYRYAESSTECLSPCAAPSVPAARGSHMRHGSRRCLGEHGADNTLHAAVTTFHEPCGCWGGTGERRPRGAPRRQGGLHRGVGRGVRTAHPWRLHWGQQAAQGAIRPAASGSESGRALSCEAAQCAGRTRRLAGTIFNNCSTVILQSRVWMI